MTTRLLSSFALACAAAANLVCLPQPAHATTFQVGGLRVRSGANERADISIAVPDGSALDINLRQGEIVVTGGSGSTMRIRASVPASALSVNATSPTVLVRLQPNMAGADISLRIEVPSGVHVSVGVSNGTVIARQLGGNLQVHSGAGDVEITGVRGMTTVDAITGDVRAERLSGGAQVNVTSGDVTLDNARGDIFVRTVSGGIVLTDIHSSLVRAESMSGEITYQGSVDRAGRYNFATHSGNVSVVIPSTNGASVRPQSVFGRVRNDFASRGTGARQVSAVGRYSDSSPGVNVTSVTGNISIQRGEGRLREDY